MFDVTLTGRPKRLLFAPSVKTMNVTVRLHYPSQDGCGSHSIRDQIKTSSSIIGGKENIENKLREGEMLSESR